jgi:hypothetical protein
MTRNAIAGGIAVGATALVTVAAVPTSWGLRRRWGHAITSQRRGTP